MRIAVFYLAVSAEPLPFSLPLLSTFGSWHAIFSLLKTSMPQALI
jgi:hypothetical protein